VARKLKTYTTSAGFFDLAIAAPSMKAALEAWGSTSNLFHQGFARLSDDPKIVAATMAKPGLILRRPVGTSGAFAEHAELPNIVDISQHIRPAAKIRPKTVGPAPRRVDEKTARAAAVAFDREHKRRQRQSRREELAQQKERERRDRAIAAATVALEDGKRAHEASIAELEKARATLDRKREAEEVRWKKKREQLEGALRQARSPGYLRLV
jgi:colicin import membrane protein